MSEENADIQALEARVTKLENSMTRVTDCITAIKVLVETNTNLTREIHSVIESINGFVRVLRWIGTGLKLLFQYVVIPGAFLVALIYALVNSGSLPDWFKALRALTGN